MSVTDDPPIVWPAAARKWVTHCKSMYSETKNPVWVWRAYEAGRTAKCRQPRWVLAYFDTAARNILRLTVQESVPRRKQIAPAIAESLGFFPGGIRDVGAPGDEHLQDKPKKAGYFNPFDRLDDERDRILAVVVARRVKDGEQLLYAYQHTARGARLSQRTVERAWKKHRSFAEKLVDLYR